MEQRIRTVRKNLKLTQTEFGARIGVKGNTVTGYETGLRTPSDAIILSICREFNVSEHWLRTGEGDMLVSHSPSQNLAAFFGSVLAGGEQDFRFRLLSVLARLSPDQWLLLETISHELHKEVHHEKT